MRAAVELPIFLASNFFRATSWEDSVERSMWLAGLVALAVVGCSDLEGPDAKLPRLTSENPEGPVVVSNNEDFNTGDMAGHVWFGIEFDVNQTLKPNEPILVDVTYTANFATDQADLRITLPEVESAKLSAWDNEFKPSVGVQFPAKLEVSRAFSQGDQISQSTAFVVEAPGIYRVHATARSGKIDPDETDQRAQPVAHGVMWLLVDEDGGRVLGGTFDAEAVPKGFRRHPGPFVEIDTGEAKPDQTGQMLASSQQQASCSSSVVCFQAYYYDHDLWTHQWVPGIGYSYSIFHELVSSPIHGSGHANSIGRFDAQCPSIGADASGSLNFNGPRMEILPASYVSFDFDRTDCGDFVPLYAPSNPGRLWTSMWYTIDRSRNRFPSRGQVEIYFNHPDSSDEACLYARGPDRIEIVSNTTRDCLWHYFGTWVVAHEYGHALHHAKMGGLPDPGNTCSPHGPGMETSLACAYLEGFANFHGVVARTTTYDGFPVAWPDGLPVTWVDIETNEFHDTGDDGSIDEGEVASFFFDLWDEGSETGDNFNISGFDLAEVMDDCRVRYNGAYWSDPAGIDHLIWCLEAGVDEDITDDYFTTRPSSYNQDGQNQSGHSWDANDIRRLWLLNLYGEEN